MQCCVQHSKVHVQAVRGCSLLNPHPLSMLLLLLLLQVNKAFSERRKMMRNTLQPLYTAQQVRRCCLHSEWAGPIQVVLCTVQHCCWLRGAMRAAHG
jgi:hypothetical protein